MFKSVDNVFTVGKNFNLFFFKKFRSSKFNLFFLKGKIIIYFRSGNFLTAIITISTQKPLGF